MTTEADTAILRDLAKQYMDVCNRDDQPELRKRWSEHNALKGDCILIHVRAFAWHELPERECKCEDPFIRGLEGNFRRELTRSTFGDDTIFEPWITVGAAKKCGGWGVEIPRHRTGDAGGAFKVDYPIKEEADIAKLREPFHEIDEEKTTERADRARELIGDIVEINVDRGPAYRMFSGDISTDLGYLRGIEHFMMDMMDRPEWLKELAGFLGRGILKTHDEAEAAGDWGLANGLNQTMPYADDLPAPKPNSPGVKRSAIWGYAAAQEFTGVSPAMHEEFLLQFQMPIMKKFGLVAYGCCEDLTNKIDMLRTIPNLRRIAVAPVADVARCAEQIGSDYVMSYRPSPADMVSYSFDADRIRGILRSDLEACRGYHVDITLKDVQTVDGDADRIRNFVKIAREVADEISS